MAVIGGDRLATAKRLARWAVRSYVVMIVLGLVIGLQVAPVLSQYAADPAGGTIAVIPLEGGITGSNAASLTARLERAQSSPAIDAVVLRVNSPGGGAAASESMYFDVARTARRMPVVTSVGSMAASGGYYAAVPSHAIYVSPSTLIGSVGVFLTLPAVSEPRDDVVTSGPNKLSGADRRDWYYKTQSIKRAFVGAVVENRGDRLDLTAEEVGYAKLYTGSEAVSNGMADRIGGLDAAIRRAASMAGLSRYRTVVIGYDGTVEFLTRANYLASNASEKTLISPSVMATGPKAAAAPNVLMLPRSVVQAAIRGAGNRTGVSVNATVAG